MPPQHNRLTQARVLALLDAAETAIKQFTALGNHVKVILEAEVPKTLETILAFDNLTPEQLAALEYISILFNDVITQATARIPYDSMMILVAERTHFNPSRIKINDKSRELMQELRASKPTKAPSRRKVRGRTTSQALYDDQQLEDLGIKFNK